MIRDTILRDSKMGKLNLLGSRNAKRSLYLHPVRSEPDNTIMDNDEADGDMVDILEEKIFSDTRITKELSMKYLSIRLFLVLLLGVNMFFGLVIYDFIARDSTNVTAICKLFSGLNTFITFFSLGIWIYGFKFRAILVRERLEIDSNIDFLVYYGHRRLFMVIFMFLLHPFEPFLHIPFFWKENYFEPNNTFSTYDRPTIEHFIIFQFVFNTSLLIKILFETIKYANDRSHRIASFFDIRIGFVYMLRAVMKSSPLLFVACFHFFGIVFFGILVRITESGYLKHIPTNLQHDDYLTLFDQRSIHFLYYNAFWNIIITMATVGY